jgi:hypothetical protein
MHHSISHATTNYPNEIAHENVIILIEHHPMRVPSPFWLTSVPFRTESSDTFDSTDFNKRATPADAFGRFLSYINVKINFTTFSRSLALSQKYGA